MARDTTTALVTCYNKADFILQCVEALVKCKEIDIIIVYDDASTDASLDLLQQTFGECTKVIILSGTKNKGVAYSRNHLLASVKTGLVIFADGDDIILSRAKDRQIQNFRQDPNNVFSYSNYERKSNLNTKYIKSGKFLYNRLKTHNFIPFSSVIIRYNDTITFEAIHHEDYMLWLTYLKGLSPCAIDYFEEATFIYNDVANSLSSNLLKGILSNFKIKRKAGIGIIETHLRTLAYLLIVTKKRWM